MTSMIQYTEMLKNVSIPIGGAIGLYLAWLRVTAANRQAVASIEQAELSRRTHVAELFNYAVGKLTDEKLEIRLGAIYTLRQISRDFPDLASAVFELFSTFVRENEVDYGDEEPPVDVREIIEILKKQNS